MVILSELTDQEKDLDEEMSAFDLHAPIWKDIVPVPQNDGPEPLCPILYDPQYVRAMSLFRALREKNEGQMEVSERALALTDMLVHMNPANYTVWQCRAHVLIQMALSGQENDRLYKELDFLDTFALVNMKNYQVWYANMTLTRRQHRKLIVSILGDPSRELEFVSSVLNHDGKNYHTWAYRQWILAHFGGLGLRDESVSAVGAGQYPHFWASDIAYADKMIQNDVRNNSAYNHRWYCIFGRAMHGRSELPAEMEEVRDAEINYALEKIAMAPHNASAWNYLRGLHLALQPKRALSSLNERIREYIVDQDQGDAAQLPEQDRPCKTPPYALEWLFDSCVETTEQDAMSKATRLDLLARLRRADPTREKYWLYREQTLP